MRYIYGNDRNIVNKTHFYIVNNITISGITLQVSLNLKRVLNTVKRVFEQLKCSLMLCGSDTLVVTKDPPLQQGIVVGY